MSAVAFVQAQRARALIVRDFERALADVDVIVTPTTADDRAALSPTQGDELDEAMINRVVAFTFAQNLTRPAGDVGAVRLRRDGMPVGLQIIAPHGDDLRALAVARAVEEVTQRHKPKVWCSPL